MELTTARPVNRKLVRAAVALAAAVMALGVGSGRVEAQAEKVQAPQPTVPEIFTLMGQYVRVAYNNQGFVTLGYRIVQESIGQDWVMLEVGMTMRSPAKDRKITRADLTLKTPDGAIVPLATQKEFAEAGYLQALQMRARVMRDAINYFPVDARRPCAIRFFAEPNGGLAFDEVELSSERGCVGRLFFKVPGGIKVGQHWLHVNFGESEVQVPFRVLTKEEAKQFEKSWEDIKKQHEASYKN